MSFQDTQTLILKWLHACTNCFFSAADVCSGFSSSAAVMHCDEAFKNICNAPHYSEMHGALHVVPCAGSDLAKELIVFWRGSGWRLRCSANRAVSPDWLEMRRRRFQLVPSVSMSVMETCHHQDSSLSFSDGTLFLRHRTHFPKHTKTCLRNSILAVHWCIKSENDCKKEKLLTKTVHRMCKGLTHAPHLHLDLEQ